MQFFHDLLRAAFLSRPNRFVVRCDIGGRTVSAYLPNPGRLWELLFPGTPLLLEKLSPSPERKFSYLFAAVLRDGNPVMLHTHHTNLVARKLLEDGLVPGLEGAEVVQQEHRVGSSRFDFLLRQGGQNVLLEVKSCTLYHKRLAMFPDAVSARATKHLLELAELSRNGYSSAVLFVVHAPQVRWFMPEHHTDLAFCRTLLDVRDRVRVMAVAVTWEDDLTLRSGANELFIPWDLVAQESHDRGNYLVVLKLPRDRRIPVGGLGVVQFRKGWYIYVGSAMQGLSRRLERHRRLTKRMHWHIDYLRQHTEFISGMPIRATVDRECEIASSLSKIADLRVPGFGSSDCSCPTHLFSFDDDPFRSRAFSDLLLHFRMGKLEEVLDKRIGT